MCKYFTSERAAEHYPGQTSITHAFIHQHFIKYAINSPNNSNKQPRFNKSYAIKSKETLANAEGHHMIQRDKINPL